MNEDDHYDIMHMKAEEKQCTSAATATEPTMSHPSVRS